MIVYLKREKLSSEIEFLFTICELFVNSTENTTIETTQSKETIPPVETTSKETTKPVETTSTETTPMETTSEETTKPVETTKNNKKK